jgi:predicted adenine nucleotide alpha hydrolase (AANH) superfamily ATPase
MAEHDLVVYFDNPNIHPAGEYRRRLATLREYARDHGIEVIEGEYDPAAWIEAVSHVVSDPVERCRACFRLRLDRSAGAAKANGCDAFATTLTVSPYQDGEAIREAGTSAAHREDIEYLHEDHRPRYQEAVRRSRELDMYRQNYCGCLLSELEAEESRRANRRGA